MNPATDRAARAPNKHPIFADFVARDLQKLLVVSTNEHLLRHWERLVVKDRRP